MLIKADLSAIGKLFDEKFDKKFDEKFDKKFDEKFESSFSKHTKSIKEDVMQIRKDQKVIVRFFDSEYLSLRKRVERIEEYLKFSAIN